MSNTIILKNTLFLYIRMIVITLVSLYTVRVTLDVLGLEDYGLYNLIGGIVGLLSIITTTLTTSTQRFLSYELGKENNGSFSKYFSISIILFVGIAILLTVTAELFLPELIRFKFQVPQDRLNACIKVFHITILTFTTNLITIPFSSSIIAHEKMSFYAYLSILETVLKLIILYLLISINGDKLVLYALLLLGVTVIVTIVNILYCHINFRACRFNLKWDNNFIKQFFSFIGWSSFGAITSVLTIQGITIIINIFFGAIANAAKAIADRIFNTVFLLVSNIILAATPHLTKEVAARKYDQMLPTFYSISRLSFFLIFIIVIPCCISMEPILIIWLGEDDCTELMIILSQITLISMLFSSLETPISMMVRAKGDIRRYQIVNGIISILLIPFTILAYKYNLPAYSYAIIQAILLFVTLFPRVYILKQLFPDVSIDYYKAVVKPILKVSIISFIIILPVIFFIPMLAHNLILLIFSSLIILCTTYVVGTNPNEKKYIQNIIYSKLRLLRR